MSAPTSRSPRLLLLPAILALSACGSLPPGPTSDGMTRGDGGAVPPKVSFPGGQPGRTGGSRGGGYYQDDGPGNDIPDNLAAIPDAVPGSEPPHRYANKPYNVFGRDYLPLAGNAPYHARGIASWYGRKFHGQKTSSGEPYDMYAMTGAHPTLPIPSWVRVSNPANGRSVVVRINDRGPFHADRLIDLSYTAAWKLGYIGQGSTLVDVERLLPGQGDGGPSAGAPPAASAHAPLGAPAAQVARAADLDGARDAAGTWLQLGAFSSRENAESFLAHLQRELARDGLAGSNGVPLEGKLVVRSAGLWHRVQLGPWPDPDSARALAAELRQRFNATPVVLTR